MPILQQHTNDVETTQRELIQMKPTGAAQYQRFWSAFANQRRAYPFLRGIRNCLSYAPNTSQNIFAIFVPSSADGGELLDEDWDIVGQDLYTAIEKYRVTEHSVNHAAEQTPEKSSR